MTATRKRERVRERELSEIICYICDIFGHISCVSCVVLRKETDLPLAAFESHL